MKKLAIDEGIEHKPEGQQANANTPEEIILVPEKSGQFSRAYPQPSLG